MKRTNKRYDVFISYCHADASEFATWLASRLRENGLSVFIDQTEIMIGDEIVDTLATVIRDSAYFVMLVSPKYFASGWCKKEMFQILTREANKAQSIILPIVASMAPSEIPPHISSKLCFRLLRGNWKECVNAIISRIRRDQQETPDTASSARSLRDPRVLDLAKDNPRIS